MKKRLLALALCLVMMTSLLPLTAAAYYSQEEIKNWIGLVDGKTYCGDTYFTVNCPSGVKVRSVKYGTDDIKPEPDGRYKLEARPGQQEVVIAITDTEGNTYGPIFSVTINSGHTDNDGDCKCDDCGASVHVWQFKVAGNTLTAYCKYDDITPVSISLVADSVTLPNSPFNARLVGWEAFKQAVPSADYDRNSFDYKLNGKSVTDKSNPKAGKYQAGIAISGIPGIVINDGGVAEFFGTYLIVQYTAVDPAVTAQTGDNRPIELMLGSVLVFSALAAAAFIVDSKRKYQQ